MDCTREQRASCSRIVYSTTQRFRGLHQLVSTERLQPPGRAIEDPDWAQSRIGKMEMPCTCIPCFCYLVAVKHWDHMLSLVLGERRGSSTPDRCQFLAITVNPGPLQPLSFVGYKTGSDTFFEIDAKRVRMAVDARAGPLISSATNSILPHPQS